MTSFLNVNREASFPTFRACITLGVTRKPSVGGIDSRLAKLIVGFTKWISFGLFPFGNDEHGDELMMMTASLTKVGKFALGESPIASLKRLKERIVSLSLVLEVTHANV